MHTVPHAEISGSSAIVEMSRPLPPVSSSGAEWTQGGQEAADLERLAFLWQSRTQEGTGLNFPIGPGDVLEISVPAMEELSGRVVRVSDDGTISLPFVGAVQTRGLTERGLKEELQRRLEKDYMYDPQVNLFVREYRSRQVAVVGAVEKPGLYSLAGGTDSLLDMISLAGGMRKEAASQILFSPAEPGVPSKANELASTEPLQPLNASSPLLALKSADPIVIDLQSLTKEGNQIYLSLPARPGDVIMVPGVSGEVLIGGWVAKPGSHRITPGLTVLGAVTAAGGPLFPAKTSAVKLIRTDKEGEKKIFLADLGKITRGEGLDIPIQEGDIIEVSSSAAKLMPYGIYHFFTTVFRVGARVPFF